MRQEQRCLTPTYILMHATHATLTDILAACARDQQGSRAQDHLSKFMSLPPAGVAHVLVTVVIVFA